MLTESKAQVKTLPHAVQYLQCTPEAEEVCRTHNRFCTKCWIDRDDVDPGKVFANEMAELPPGGQVSWHMGWRQHLLTSRVLVMTILDGLQTAMQTFSEGTMGMSCQSGPGAHVRIDRFVLKGILTSSSWSFLLIISTFIRRTSPGRFRMACHGLL
jgi:hypothetical protein